MLARLRDAGFQDLNAVDLDVSLMKLPQVPVLAQTAYRKACFLAANLGGCPEQETEQALTALATLREAIHLEDAPPGRLRLPRSPRTALRPAERAGLLSTPREARKLALATPALVDAVGLLLVGHPRGNGSRAPPSSTLPNRGIVGSR